MRHELARTKSDVTTRRCISVGDQDDSAISDRLSVRYRLENGMVAHANHGTSLQRITGSTFEGEPFKPTRGKQGEPGIRPAPGNDLQGTAAIFGIRQTTG